MFPEEYCSSAALHAAISSHAARLVICHEAAPAWRHNVLRGAPHLLALRSAPSPRPAPTTCYFHVEYI